jgi:hypothetical protein
MGAAGQPDHSGLHDRRDLLHPEGTKARVRLVHSGLPGALPWRTTARGGRSTSSGLPSARQAAIPGPT